MFKITFKYRDEYNYPNWSEQQCILDSVEKCIELYGLHECEYEILKIEQV